MSRYEKALQKAPLFKAPAGANMIAAMQNLKRNRTHAANNGLAAVHDEINSRMDHIECALAMQWGSLLVNSRSLAKTQVETLVEARVFGVWAVA